MSAARRVRDSALVALLSCALLVACDDDNGRSFRIRTVETELGAGQIFTVRLTSLSNRTIYYNLCPSVYERRLNGPWVSVPETRPEACLANLEILPPGGEIDVLQQVPVVVTPGTYRILFETVAFREDRPVPPLPLEPLPESDRRTNSFAVVTPTLQTRSASGSSYDYRSIDP